MLIACCPASAPQLHRLYGRSVTSLPERRIAVPRGGRVPGSEVAMHPHGAMRETFAATDPRHVAASQAQRLWRLTSVRACPPLLKPPTPQSEAIRSHQKPSEAIRSHQKPPEAIRSRREPPPLNAPTPQASRAHPRASLSPPIPPRSAPPSIRYGAGWEGMRGRGASELPSTVSLGAEFPPPPPSHSHASPLRLIHSAGSSTRAELTSAVGLPSRSTAASTCPPSLRRLLAASPPPPLLLSSFLLPPSSLLPSLPISLPTIAPR